MKENTFLEKASIARKEYTFSGKQNTDEKAKRRKQWCEKQ